jgi:hypothetical protein
MIAQMFDQVKSEAEAGQGSPAACGGLRTVKNWCSFSIGKLPKNQHIAL